MDTMTRARPVSQVLNRTADLIEQRGWTRGASGWDPGRGGSLCLEGALIAAQDLTVSSGKCRCGCGGWAPLNEDTMEALVKTPAYRALARYLEISDGARLFHWNDGEARDGKHVVEVLRAAAQETYVQEQVDGVMLTHDGKDFFIPAVPREGTARDTDRGAFVPLAGVLVAGPLPTAEDVRLGSLQPV